MAALTSGVTRHQAYCQSLHRCEQEKNHNLIDAAFPVLAKPDMTLSFFFSDVPHYVLYALQCHVPFFISIMPQHAVLFIPHRAGHLHTQTCSRVRGCIRYRSGHMDDVIMMHVDPRGHTSAGKVKVNKK